MKTKSKYRLSNFIFENKNPLILGQGSFSNVIMVTNKNDNKKYAIKIINLNNYQSSE